MLTPFLLCRRPVARAVMWAWAAVVVAVLRAAPSTGDASASAFDARQQESPRPAFRTPAGPRNRPEPYSLSWARAGRQAPVPLQFSASSEVGASILNHVTQYGINETRYLTAVKEPKLFEEGESPRGLSPLPRHRVRSGVRAIRRIMRWQIFTHYADRDHISNSQHGS